MSLPNIYSKSNYLESTGTQYINLGAILNPHPSDYKIVADFQFTDISNGNGKLFGVVWSSYWIQAGLNGANFMMQAGGGSSEKSFGSADLVRHTWTIDHNNHQFILDSNTQTYTGTYSDVSRNLFVFCRDNYGNPNRYCLGKLYSFNIYFNDVLSYELIPAVRKSDSKPGLYDLQNNVFYVNAGSGEFNYEIPSVNKLIYNNNTLIDLTSDTVTREKLVTGITAHNAAGAVITGNVPESTAIEISTDSEMNALLTAANVGKCYKFTGINSSTYVQNEYYIVEASS